MEDLPSVRKLINTYLGLIFKIGLMVVIFSTFFLFTNIFTEFYETGKFLMLAIFTGLLLVLLALKFTLTGKVVILRTPLDIPLLLLLTVGIVSTILSPSPWVSLLGNQLKIHGSLVSLVLYILFYFVLINNLKTLKDIKWVFTLTIAAAQILAVAALLTFAGINILPESINKLISVTPTGSFFSATAVLALLVPFMVVQILHSKDIVTSLIHSLFLLVSGVTIALTGTWATWTAALFGLVLTLLINNLGNLSHLTNLLKTRPVNLICLVIPLVVIALIAILSFIPPMGSAQNPVYAKAKIFPREIQLPFATSWKISVSAFRDVPFWGTGPATYLFNFTSYKPVDFNNTKIWNLRFDSAFNEYLQVLATLGGVGLLALLSVTALFISTAYPALSTVYRLPTTAEDGSQKSEDYFKVALAISGLAFFVILALHASSLIVWVIGILILASFMVSLGSGQKDWGSSGNLKNMFMRIAAMTPARDLPEETIKIDALPGVILTAALALVLFAGFFGGKYALADYQHRLALTAVSKNQGIEAYNALVQAEKLNPNNDTYRTDLAQINFALANAIAAAKAPTEASPGGSLTDQDKQNISVLLQQSINEGRTAVTLSPRSALDWEILALLYRQISGVATNGLLFALDSYGKAIFQDPLNPQLRLSVGGVYYAAQNYDMAIRFFTDAINLKPDFANGYYNLSVALRDKGDLNGAQTLAEKLVTLVDKDTPDYKTAQDYLADLKAKNTPPAAEGSPAQPPAAETTGALQEEQLPKVIDLPKPEKIATPEAIKKPEASPETSATPAPEATP